LLKARKRVAKRRRFKGLGPRTLVVLGALLCNACEPANERGAGGFSELGEASGITLPVFSGSAEKVHIRESLGQGACWLDHDRDGDLDLFIPNGAREVRAEYETAPHLLKAWTFYVNRGGRFTEEATTLGAMADAWGIGCTVGDVDGDSYADLFVTTAAGPNRFFHNRGDGTFEDWTVRSSLGDLALSTGAAFGDLDGDGDLDLFVATYLDESRPPPSANCRWKGAAVMCGPRGYPPLDDLLYLNDGRGNFTEVSANAGLRGLGGFGLGVLMLDAEADGDLDIFVGNDSTPNRLLLNRGDGIFMDAGLMSGLALSSSGATQAAMGVDGGDLDGDGLEDLVVTNFSDDVNNFYRNDGGAIFTEWSLRSGMATSSFNRLGWSVLIEDFDLDGAPDVFVANGHVYPQVDGGDGNTSYRQPLQLLFNDGRGRLVEDLDRLGAVFEQPIAARGAAAADFDFDGDVDLVVVRDGAVPWLLRNELPNPNASWLRVTLRGRPGNPQALGAKVEVETAGRVQVRELRASRGYLSASQPALTFGLGAAETVDRLTVRWPDGGVQVLYDLRPDRSLHLVHSPRASTAERAGGSGRR
jgi:hypothetical protein